MKNTYPVLFLRWQQLTTNIQKMHAAGKLKKLPLKIRLLLFKKWKRYTKKLLAVQHPLLKALNIFCIAVSVPAITNAQCDTFKLSDGNNPLKNIYFTSPLSNPAFVDIDNDGDLDCYEVYSTASRNVGIVFLKNNGNDKLPYYQIDSASGFAGNVLTDNNFYYDGPKFVDIDGDGDYDCFMVHYELYEADYITIDYYKNIGTSTNPKFVKNTAENPVAFLNGDYFFDYNFADVDQDGDFDFIYSDLYYHEYYKNIGTVANPSFQRQVGSANPFGNLFVPGNATFYDWNKDGLVDCLTNDSYFKNIGTLGNPKFANRTDGPVLPQWPFSLSQWVDLNKDGFVETFSQNGSMAATAPEATITSQQVNATTIQLNAFPKGDYLYRWRRNGKLIPGETKDSIRISQLGRYTVEIKSSCGIGLSLPYRASTAIGIDAVDKSNAIAIDNNINLLAFPNPFTSEFTIRLNSSSNTKSTIKIADVNGKTVSEFQTSNNSIQTGKQLKAGVYFVQVLQNNVVVYRQKIVKQ